MAAKPKDETENPKDYTLNKTCAACGDQLRSDLTGRVFCPAFDANCPRYLEDK